MFENVAVIHKGMRPRGTVIEGDQKFGPVFDKNHVLPAGQMSRRRRARERRDTERRAVHVKGMSHAERDDFPHFQCAKLGFRVHTVQVVSLPVDAQAGEHPRLRRPFTPAYPAVEHELAAADGVCTENPIRVY
jgi:hypothetical protein